MTKKINRHIKRYDGIDNQHIRKRKMGLRELYRLYTKGVTTEWNTHSKSKYQPGYPDNTDERACPGCCTAVCGGYTPGTCQCTCSESTSDYWDLGCNCHSNASIQGSWAYQDQNCMEHCASPHNNQGYEIPCTCAYSVQECIWAGCTGGVCGSQDGCAGGTVECWDGSTACAGHCPAECPPDYEPEWTAGGMYIHVPGCDPHANKERSGN